MNLMNVERVQFGGAVLDDPILDVALFHDDIGHTRSRIEGLGRLAIHSDEKSGRAIGIVGVEQLFGEVQLARACGARSLTRAASMQRSGSGEAASVERGSGASGVAA